MSARSPHRIVFANEKGGTGKSTTAVHVAIALAYQGARVAALDLDPRQRTLFRYLENRAETERRREISLPGATFDVFTGDSVEQLEAQVAGKQALPLRGNRIRYRRGDGIDCRDRPGAECDAGEENVEAGETATQFAQRQPEG